MRTKIQAALVAVVLSTTAVAFADDPAMGAPPAEGTALVEAPKFAADAPKLDNGTHETTASLSAGGQFSSGNSKLIAATANGKFEML